MVATTTTSEHPARTLSGWIIVGRIMSIMTFLQPFFIGAMFSGYRDGLNAHRINAYALVLLAIGSLIVAIATQRRSPAGRKLISALAEFSVLLIVVAIIGVLSHEGYRLHWLHLPAGVGMVMGALDIVSKARDLQQPTDD